jgi:hypothetical protein
MIVRFVSSSTSSHFLVALMPSQLRMHSNIVCVLEVFDIFISTKISLHTVFTDFTAQ